MNNLFLKEVHLSPKYGSAIVEWVEYSFRSKLQANRYWVTLAAIAIPSQGKFVVGASACSPLDAYNFDRTDAANRALGRARQLACKVIAGTIDRHRQTLIGGEGECVYPYDPATEFKTLQADIQLLYPIVAANAEATAFSDDLKRLRKRYPHLRIAQGVYPAK